MKEFSTWVFVENEVRTHNENVRRSRPGYITVLILLVGIVFHLLELDEYLVYILIAAAAAWITDTFMKMGKEPAAGHHPTTLRLTPEAVYIGNEKIDITRKSDIAITIAGYDGQWKTSRKGYSKHSGKFNCIRINTAHGITKVNFVLNSENHRQQLELFCEENGFEFE